MSVVTQRSERHPKTSRTANLGSIALSGAAVTGIGQGAKMALRMMQVVILARLLTPEDLGLVAAVSPMVAFIALFQNIGLKQAIVQRYELSDGQLNQVFWVLALVGALSMALATLLSPLIAAFYSDQRMVGIIIAAAPPLLFASLGSLHIGLLGRHMCFGRIAVIDTLVAAAMLVASAGAALMGAGYWALLIGTNASAVTALFLVWVASRWRPSRPDFNIDGALFSFGANLTGSNLLNFLSRNLDSILIAKTAGVTQLGYYDRAYNLLLFPIQNAVGPLERVMIPVLSKLQHEEHRFRAAYLRAVSTLLLAIVPGIIAITLVPRSTVLLLFGERWLDIVPIFTWLGLAAIIQPQMAAGSWIFISLGRTKEQFYLSILYSTVIVSAFLIGLPWGAVGVAAAYAVANFLILPFRWFYLSRIGPVTFLDNVALVFPYVLSASLASLIISEWSVMTALPPLHSLVVALCLSYGLSLFTNLGTATGRSGLMELLGLVRALAARLR